MNHREARQLRVACLVLGGALLAAGVAANTAARAMVIEEAHGISALRRATAIEAGITVEFGGQRRLAGTMLFSVDGGRARFELDDGTRLVFDGEHAWVSPAASPRPRARFDVLTWPYFVLAPFKLRDPGTRLVDEGELALAGSSVPAMKLTFGPGVGDAPDDWYVVYADPETSRLRALAYIVTYGHKPDSAPPEPHAIVYSDEVAIDGITLARDWSFHHWTREAGPHGDPIGHVVLRDIRVVNPTPNAFERPADAREDPLPQR